MLSHIHGESSASISERTTQTRMDARLARRVALHHTIHLPPAMAQTMIFHDQARQPSVGAGETAGWGGDACVARQTLLSAEPTRTTQASLAPTDALSTLHPYELGYVMEPLVLKKDFSASGSSIATWMPGDASAGGDCGYGEWQEQGEDEDSAWLNDQVLPRQAFARSALILKEQSEESIDQQTLTCWF